MNRRQMMMLPGLALAPGRGGAQTPTPAPPNAALDNLLPPEILLKDYRPKSVYKIHVSDILKAKFPVIDCHHHSQSRTAEQVDQEVKLMDAAGLQSSVAFMGVGEGPTYRTSAFDDGYKIYSRYPKRFYIYTGLNMSGAGQPGWKPDATIAELERCHKAGAVGVGELHDKGMGIGGVMPGGSGGGRQGRSGASATPRAPVQGFHPDAPQLDAVWEKCAD